MKISYAITVCNELEEVKSLLSFLHLHKRVEDEICVLLDKPKASHLLIDELYKWASSDKIKLKESSFNNHFADWKNELNRMCSGDFIFQLDADELPTEELIEALPYLINQEVDIILIPRENTVKGITDEHIQKWNWNVDDLGRINWPDYQWRFYKNLPTIKWVNKVHERLDGYKLFGALPNNLAAGPLYIKHPKTIEKQEKQNSYYDTL